MSKKKVRSSPRRRKAKALTIAIEPTLVEWLDQHLSTIHEQSGYALALLRQFAGPKGGAR